MRQKLSWITIAVLAVALAASHAQSPKGQTPSPSQTGPYMLFAGEHDIGAGVFAKDILRVNTQTGAVDVWVSGNDKNGHFMNGWVRIGEK